MRVSLLAVLKLKCTCQHWNITGLRVLDLRGTGYVPASFWGHVCGVMRLSLRLEVCTQATALEEHRSNPSEGSISTAAPPWRHRRQ